MNELATNKHHTAHTKMLPPSPSGTLLIVVYNGAPSIQLPSKSKRKKTKLTPPRPKTQLFSSIQILVLLLTKTSSCNVNFHSARWGCTCGTGALLFPPKKKKSA